MRFYRSLDEWPGVRRKGARYLARTICTRRHCQSVLGQFQDATRRLTLLVSESSLRLDLTIRPEVFTYGDNIIDKTLNSCKTKASELEPTNDNWNMSGENIEGSQGPIETKQEREDRIDKELRQIIDGLYDISDDVMIEVSGRVVAFLKMIEGKYPDKTITRSYRLFNILNGSTHPCQPPHLDFEGELSLEAFVRNLDREYRGK